MVMTVAITREEYSATRVRTHYPSQNVMVAAMQMAEKNVCPQRSWRVAMRRQSLRRPRVFSMRCRWR